MVAAIPPSFSLSLVLDYASGLELIQVNVPVGIAILLHHAGVRNSRGESISLPRNRSPQFDRGQRLLSID